MHEWGADEIFLKQFDDPDFAIADFEPMSVYEGKSYGFSNGVYVFFAADMHRLRYPLLFRFRCG